MGAAIRVPVWVGWMFPGGRSLGANPLYIRLTGQGFAGGGGAPRFGRWEPPEVSSPGAWSTIGLLPILLVAAPSLYGLRSAPAAPTFRAELIHAFQGLTDIAYILGVTLLFARATDCEVAARVRGFLGRGLRDPRTEALLLTSLRPDDCERALFAGLWQRQVVSLASRFGILVACIAPVVAVWAVVLRALGPNSPLPPGASPEAILGEVLRFAPPVLLAAWLELCAIASLNLAVALRFARAPEARRWTTRAAEAGFAGLVFGAAHLPGAVAYYLWTAARIGAGLPLESSQFGLMDTGGMIAFAVPSAACGLLLARFVLRRNAGGVGRVIEGIYAAR